MITRVLLAAILACGGTLGSIAAELPKEGKLDNRIRFVDYDPHQVTQIVSALFVSTQIEFGARLSSPKRRVASEAGEQLLDDESLPTRANLRMRAQVVPRLNSEQTVQQPPVADLAK